MLLQYTRHQLHATRYVGVEIVCLLDEDGLTDVKEVAVGIAVVVANRE